MLKDKRAVSEIIGYVLLIVIAISLSFVVYAWLKNYIPVKEVSCPDGVSLIMLDYSCDSSRNVINITLQNKGRFNLDGFIIHFTNTSGLPIYSLGVGEVFFDDPLRPAGMMDYGASYSGYSKITLIEIEPIKVIDNEIVLCKERLISEEINNCE